MGGTSVRKTIYLTVGMGLVVLGVVIAPLPGPGGLPVALVGTVVLLKASPAMRRRWVRARKRWPGVVGPMDKLLRRRTLRKRMAA